MSERFRELCRMRIAALPCTELLKQECLISSFGSTVLAVLVLDDRKQRAASSPACSWCKRVQCSRACTV